MMQPNIGKKLHTHKRLFDEINVNVVKRQSFHIDVRKGNDLIGGVSAMAEISTSSS